MSCEDVGKQLTLFIYGELTFDEEEALERHMDACAACRTELETMRRMSQALDANEAELPAGLLNRCRRDLRYTVRAAKTAHSGGRGFLHALGALFTPAAGWLKPVGALTLVALGFFSARLTTLANRATAPVEPVSARVRSIEPDAAGGIRLVVEETRQRVLRGRLEDDSIRQMLLTAAKDPSDAGLRVESVDLLKSRPDSAEVHKALLAALRHDPNAGVRLKAIEGLKSFNGDPETRRVLAEVLLCDDNPGVRTLAVDLLIERRDAAMAGVLQELLRKENNSYVRLRSQKALREMNASVETF